MPSITISQLFNRPFRSITDEPEPGTVTYSKSIVDDGPVMHVAPSIYSPSDQADIEASTLDPEETYEEYMERHAHE